jgi:hypothetical protein
MSGRILDEAPIAGQYPEVHFGQGFIYARWIEFEDGNYEKWVGCFSCPCEDGFDQIIFDDQNQFAFVIAGGQGYLLDVASRELLYQTNEYPLIESVLYTRNPAYFLAGASYCIYVFNHQGLLKEIRPDNFIDGIQLQRQESNKVIGVIDAYMYDDCKVRFELDLENLTIQLLEDIKTYSIGPFAIIRKVPKQKE